MCTLFWQIVFGQVVLTHLWPQLIYTPWKWCSGNNNPCTPWCLCCNRWLCWIGLVLLAIVLIVFDIFITLVAIAVLGICETLCVIGTILGYAPSCFAYSAPSSSPPVRNQPPVALTDGPYRGVIGQTISMSAAASSDPEGDMLTATWQLGDGTTLTGMAISHAYANAGLFTVTVTVSDGPNTATATTTANIVGIGGAPPPPTE